MCHSYKFTLLYLIGSKTPSKIVALYKASLQLKLMLARTLYNYREPHKINFSGRPYFAITFEMCAYPAHIVSQVHCLVH